MRSFLVLGVISLLLVLAVPLLGEPAGARGSYHVLVVASDISDIIWSHILSIELEHIGVNVSIKIAYIGKDNPSAPAVREKLSDIGFLWRYDAVLLPDVNKEFTWGGKLGKSEIDALRLYARRGHLVLLGLNTFVQHWYPALEQMCGVKTVGLRGGSTDTPMLDIVVNGTIYHYNDTFRAVLVSPTGCKAIATFHEYPYPAICVNKYGKGLVVLAAFNVVKAVVAQKDGADIAALLARILAKQLASIEPQPPPTSYVIGEKLRSALLSPYYALIGLARRIGGGLLGYSVALVVAALLTYVALLALSMLCLLPRRLRVIVARPLAKLAEPWERELQVLRMIRDKEPISAKDLASKTSMCRFSLCAALTLLEARRLLVVIKHGSERLYVYRDDLAKIIVEMNPLYRGIVELVEKEPGITIHEIAARLSTPPDLVLNACKYLASIGVVELRKVSFEYEVYPASLLRS